MLTALFRNFLMQRLVAVLMLLSLGLGILMPARAELPFPPNDGGGGGISMPPGICKPPPMQCLTKDAKEQWAKDHHCKFLEDVCSKTSAADDKNGASAADQGFWGDLWSGVKDGLVYGYEFVKGLFAGLKGQVTDLYHMVTNPTEAINGFG